MYRTYPAPDDNVILVSTSSNEAELMSRQKLARLSFISYSEIHTDVDKFVGFTSTTLKERHGFPYALFCTSLSHRIWICTNGESSIGVEDFNLPNYCVYDSSSNVLYQTPYDITKGLNLLDCFYLGEEPHCIVELYDKVNHRVEKLLLFKGCRDKSVSLCWEVDL